MRIKEIAIIGMMSAILFTVQVALGFLPNIELVSLLIILYTLTFRWKTIYIIYTFVLLEGLMYGFGIWWINYLYVWLVLFIIAMIFKKKQSPILWAFILGAYGLSFGALCSIPYFIMGGIPTGFANWISGIPFDLAHGVGNFVIALVLYRPLSYLLNLAYKTYR